MKMSKRNRSQVNAFNLVPVVEQVLPDRAKAEVRLRDNVNVLQIFFSNKSSPVYCTGIN